MSNNRRSYDNDNNQRHRRNSRNDYDNRRYENNAPQRNSRNDYNEREDYDDHEPRRRNNNYNDRPRQYSQAPQKSNKGLIIALAALGAVAVAAGASFMLKKDATAQIISVTPNMVNQQQPYQSCHKVGTTSYVKNQKNGTEGALIGGATGAVAGGIIGNQVKQGGGGTAVGALVGGATGALVGSSVQKSNQPDYIAKKGSNTQCHTAYKTVRTQNGYNVQYLYKDNTASIITQTAPAIGSKIPMEQLQAMAVPATPSGGQ